MSNNKMRVALITLGSTLATTAVVANAYYQKKQFYPSVVYLTKSNPCLAVSSSYAFFNFLIIFINFPRRFPRFKSCIIVYNLVKESDTSIVLMKVPFKDIYWLVQK